MEATSAPRPHAIRIPRPRKYLAALSDERLVEHIRRGEPAAFEVLYDRHSGGVLGFCRHMLGNAADAEDAVQHTFIAAHADILRHDKRELHVKAWLYTIARNRCLSMLRARHEHADADRVELSADNLVHDVEHRDDIRALLGDVAKLPEEQRGALVLAEVGDLSHSEISEVLGCEVSKVKSLVFQARTALIDRRAARETPCAEIREQLATLRGGALRRSQLRHHLEACPGCTEYREEVRRQRAMLAVALPVLPSAALKAKVLGGVGLGSSTAAAATAGAGGVAATATGGGIGLAAPGGIAAKVGLVAVLAVGGAGGATVAQNGNLPLIHDSKPATTKPAPQSHSATAATSAAHTSTTGESASALSPGRQKKLEKETNGSQRSASGTEHGFTPITGESNGERARAFAQTRGKGEETSAARRHTTAHDRARPVKPEKVKHVAAPKQGTERTPPAARTQPPPAPKANVQPTTTQPAPVPTTTTPTPTTTTESSIPPGSGSGGGSGKTGGAVGKVLQTG